jgi:hypothetical protein
VPAGDQKTEIRRVSQAKTDTSHWVRVTVSLIGNGPVYLANWVPVKDVFLIMPFNPPGRT